MSEIDKPSSTSAVGTDVESAPDREGSQTAFMARRRHLAKLGKLSLGAPVLATLASRPVFAGQCLSNMMSGNLSPPLNRGNCSTGASPGGWGNPGGGLLSYSTTPAAWAAIDLLYGNLNKNGNANKYDDYTGGATVVNVPRELNRGGIETTTLLREVLTDPKLDKNMTRHFVCAYLNALLSGLSGSSFTYILSTQQVLGIANGTIPIPTAFSSTNAFFDSTWT